MSTFLLGATPVYGHVAPMITIGRHLVSAGHRVSLLTGSRFAESAAAAGMTHIALPAGADYDDRDIAGAFPETERLTGIRRLRFDVENNFIAVMPHQYRGVREQLEKHPVRRRARRDRLHRSHSAAAGARPDPAAGAHLWGPPAHPVQPGHRAVRALSLIHI